MTSMWSSSWDGPQRLDAGRERDVVDDARPTPDPRARRSEAMAELWNPAGSGVTCASPTTIRNAPVGHLPLRHGIQLAHDQCAAAVGPHDLDLQPVPGR